MSGENCVSEPSSETELYHEYDDRQEQTGQSPSKRKRMGSGSSSSSALNDVAAHVKSNEHGTEAPFSDLMRFEQTVVLGDMSSQTIEPNPMGDGEPASSSSSSELPLSTAAAGNAEVIRSVEESKCTCECKCDTKGQLGLPLASLDEFDAMEIKLANNEKGIKTRLTNLIALIGVRSASKDIKGGNYGGHLREALKFLMGGKVKSHFNYEGRGGSKRQFKGTLLQQVLYDAIRHKQRLDVESGLGKKEDDVVTDYKLKSVTQNWLKAVVKKVPLDDSSVDEDDEGHTRQDSIFPPGCPCKCTCETSLAGIQLPIKSMVELEAIENGIENNEGLYLRLRTRLTVVKSKRLKLGDQVRAVLKKLISEEVRINLNWDGRKGKHAFRRLSLKNVFFDAIRCHTSFSNATDMELKTVIQLWLKPEAITKAKARKS